LFFFPFSGFVKALSHYSSISVSIFSASDMLSGVFNYRRTSTLVVNMLFNLIFSSGNINDLFISNEIFICSSYPLKFLQDASTQARFL